MGRILSRSVALVVALGLPACAVLGDDAPEESFEESEEALSLTGVPSVSGVAPGFGPAAGGTPIEVRGSNFARGATVSIGGKAGVSARRISRSLIRVTTPAGAGAVAVRVKNPNGRESNGAVAFTYEGTTPPPPPTDAGAPPPPPTDGGTTPPASCALAASGPVHATADGQVIENLRITSSTGPGIEVSGRSNVVIRNVEVLHNGGPGIAFDNANGLRIENVRIVHTGAPAKGANPSDDRNNIEGFGSTGILVDHARLERGSSGVYLISCPRPVLRFLEGHDFRGPFPRGQLAQLDKSDDGLVEDFSVENLPEVSWPEDNISFFQSARGTVRRGLIVGNNSPSGVGVMFEAYAGVGNGGLAEDVETIDMGNGSFSAYPSRDVTFRRARTRDTHCGSQQGRGAPLSNALLFGAPPESSNIRIEAGKYFNHCNPENLVWDDDRFTLVDLVQENFTPRPPQRLAFCWSPPAFR